MIDSKKISYYFILREDYTGSIKGMRYRIVKRGDQIVATAWPEPFNFIKTSDEKKISSSFECSQEGKEKAVEWLNTQYKELKPLWDSAH